MKSSGQRDLESAFNGVAAIAAKWRKRAWQFRDAYNDAKGEVMGLEIHLMQLKAYGSDTTAWETVANLRAKMLELARERNELQEKLRHLEGQARCSWCGESAEKLNWIKYATVCPPCTEKGRVIDAANQH